MKNPRNIKKTSAGNPGRVNRILKQAARVVGYLLASLAMVAAVSSCAATWEPFDCNAQPEVCL